MKLGTTRARISTSTLAIPPLMLRSGATSYYHADGLVTPRQNHRYRTGRTRSRHHRALVARVRSWGQIERTEVELFAHWLRDSRKPFANLPDSEFPLADSVGNKLMCR